MELISFIAEAFIVVIPALYIVGVFIKNTNIIRDELIPIILMILGIVFCSGIAQTIDVNTVIQGILCTGVAVLGNQTVKQVGKIVDEER